MALHGKEKVGVLLVNTGTPSAPEPKAVKRYLAQFLMDKHIAPMNRFIWWFILHLAILPKRSVAEVPTDLDARGVALARNAHGARRSARGAP